MRGPVTVLRLEHGKASALDTELLDALADAVEGLKGAAVLTGTGSIFCAGVDLFRVVEGGAPYLETFAPALQRSFRALFDSPHPVVAAANGHAIAGGCILVNACDCRLIAGGRIGIPELAVGVPFPSIALEIMRFALPSRYVQEAIYSGRTYELDEALQRGLVDEIVPPEGLIDRACEVAAAYAAKPAAAFALTKRQMRAPYLARVSDATDREVFEVWGRPETLDTIRAYLEKTVGRKK